MFVFWESSIESKMLAIIYLVALILQSVGMFTNYLAEAEFIMPKDIDLGVDIDIGRTHVGFLKSCINFLANTTEGLKVVNRHCITKPVVDWQTAVVVLILCAAASCIVGLIPVVLNIIHAKFQDKTATKIGIAAATAASSAFMIAGLITAYVNRQDTLKLLDGVYIKMHFHIRWSFQIYGVASILYALLHVFLLVEIYISKRKYNIHSLCLRHSDYAESEPLKKDGSFTKQ
ncbi:hypothetical protein RRG08_028120 [Elysia crispata]|uniref:Uncharacterized protein n=1 Tax=Elysia crispata TaxID=231223 RepID=A0AAE1A5K4_9GAST|nr:hypothetical protein RRG08_028120 [Elysia crispata]